MHGRAAYLCRTVTECACCNLSCSVCSDVKLVAADTEIPAHRLILSARSPYFKQKMSESLEGVLRIDDNISLPGFRQLLNRDS